ncbi:MAG: GIY-YIG nuclease family protein [Paracoccaceae bacterium]
MTGFSLQDVLERAGMDPRDCNVILHTPRKDKHGDLARMLPELARTRPAAVAASMATHTDQATAALSRGRGALLSFIRVGDGRSKGTSRMLFVGLFKNRGGRFRPRSEIAQEPEIVWLDQNFPGDEGAADTEGRVWFDFALDDRLADLRGRLLIETRLTRTYVRLAENLGAAVVAIHEHGSFETPSPGWRGMILHAQSFEALPQAWAEDLRRWRGVYLIVDRSDGARYVGSAAGTENMLGRWREHLGGGTAKGLSGRDPSGFRFSILELVSPTADPGEVSRIEQTWMERLDTVEHGLNRPRDLVR